LLYASGCGIMGGEGSGFKSGILRPERIEQRTERRPRAESSLTEKGEGVVIAPLLVMSEAEEGGEAVAVVDGAGFLVFQYDFIEDHKL